MSSSAFWIPATAGRVLATKVDLIQEPLTQGHPTQEPLTQGHPTLGKWTLDQSILDQSTLDQPTLDQPTLGQLTLDQPTLGQPTLEHSLHVKVMAWPTEIHVTSVAESVVREHVWIVIAIWAPMNGTATIPIQHLRPVFGALRTIIVVMGSTAMGVMFASLSMCAIALTMTTME